MQKEKGKRLTAWVPAGPVRQEENRGERELLKM